MTVAARLAWTCARKCTTREWNPLFRSACMWNEQQVVYALYHMSAEVGELEYISIGFGPCNNTAYSQHEWALYVCILLLVAYIIYYMFIVESTSIRCPREFLPSFPLTECVQLRQSLCRSLSPIFPLCLSVSFSLSLNTICSFTPITYSEPAEEIFEVLAFLTNGISGTSHTVVLLSINKRKCMRARGNVFDCSMHAHCIAYTRYQRDLVQICRSTQCGECESLNYFLVMFAISICLFFLVVSGIEWHQPTCHHSIFTPHALENRRIRFTICRWPMTEWVIRKT